ncbi:uncharacterized protein LOC127856269 [Dreissena polymorpha]|nr:uncharacterized protein LOC127856269 [Dreissena polymorpha]
MDNVNMAAAQNSGVSQPPGSRGPAPPLPEKPPSVAERTRLLKSSFRRNEDDRPEKPGPRIVDATFARSSPLSEVTKSAGSSVSSLNSNPGSLDLRDGEDSLSGFINGRSTPPSVAGKQTVTVTTPVTPVTHFNDNKEAEHQAPISSAKREAFFKAAELPAPTPKFDPNARFTSDPP